MVRGVHSPFRRVSSLGLGYSFTLFAAGLTGICLMGGTVVVANGNVDVRACQELFQQETAKCQTLTGFARARCQQDAARRFQACRGQASPSNPGPNALASISLPGAPAPASAPGATAADAQAGTPELSTIRTRPTRANKINSRSRDR